MGRRVSSVCWLVFLLGALLGISLFRISRATSRSGYVTPQYDGQVKIGIIGPVGLPFWSPSGMKEGAELARDEINAPGGINAAGYSYEVVLVFANEYSWPTPDPSAAALEMERLCDPSQEDCDFVIGGYDPVCTGAMIEVAADYGIPFFINGAFVDELIGETVGQDYARYKYLFRISPVYGSMQFLTLTASLQYYLIPVKLLPLFGDDLDGNPSTPKQVRVAVIAEDEMPWRDWAEALMDPTTYPSLLGPHANVTYAGIIPYGTVDCTPWLVAADASNARLLIHLFPFGITGMALIVQWETLSINAMPVGIHENAQVPTHWLATGGNCEYESTVNIVPDFTTDFYRNFVGNFSTSPLHTACGAYDGIHMLAEAAEAIGSMDKDLLRVYFEDPSYEWQAVNGKFRFTGLHDVFSNEYGPTWTQGYLRAMITQWWTERMVVVYPVDQIYSKRWWIPPRMYPLITDINYDGQVDIKDIAQAARAYGTSPGHPKWDKEADINRDDKIDIKDIAAIAKDFGKSVPLPLP